jgi:hypothetical protein
MFLPPRFTSYNYTAMFTLDGQVNAEARDSFSLAVRAAFLAGVAGQTQIPVTSSANALQLDRVRVTDIRPGEASAAALRYFCFPTRA